MYYDVYFDSLERAFAQARERNRASLLTCAQIVADSVGLGGVVHIFGSGHSQLLALEAVGRAGGLAAIEVIYDPALGKAETLEGYAGTLLRDGVYVLQPPDCLIVVSNSGRNPAPIEMAQLGREAGLPVIAVTAVDFSRSVSSRHSSGKHLYELGDAVLDTCGEPGDAAVRVEGVPAATGATSTVVGAALLNAMLVQAVAELKGRGFEPPIFMSQNLDDYKEHNDALRARYRGRIRWVS